MHHRILSAVLAVTGLTGMLPAATTAVAPGETAAYSYVHVEVSTSIPAAQAAFDRGLTLIYAYNHEEAEQAFRQAAQLDPGLAMAWWGIGLALGPNINSGPVADNTHKAAEALDRGRDLLAIHGSALEREYIEALTKRYTSAAQPDFDALAVAYRDAMQALVSRHPADADATALYAEAAMDLRPWRLWSGDGKPAPGTEALVAALENGLRAHPNHMALLHFYVHAVEASADPGRALPMARRLASLPMEPAAAHLVHMPAHIYLRLGEWQDAIDANQHAAHQALDYRRSQDPKKDVACGHCLDFVVYAASMQGNLALARQAAEDAARVEEDPSNPIEVFTRFHQWDDLLVLPEPGSEQKKDMRNAHVTHALWHYGRGLALAAMGRLDRARTELGALRHEAALAPPLPVYLADKLDVAQVVDKLIQELEATVLMIADRVLAARIAESGGDTAGALALLREAVEFQDRVPYSEPPAWYSPVRESVGGLLLRTGHPGDAETVFRDSLARVPHDPRALFGLSMALAAQGRTKESAAVKAEFDTAWRHADTPLTVDAL